MASYVRLMLNELFLAIKKEIAECYKEAAIDDDILEKLLLQPTLDQTGANQYEDQ